MFVCLSVYVSDCLCGHWDELDILIIICGSQQWFMFDALFQVEECHPVSFDWLHQTEATAFQEIGDVLDGSTIEWTLAASCLEMTITAAIHALIGGHAQPNDLICLTDGQKSDPANMEEGIAHNPSNEWVAGPNRYHRSQWAYGWAKN